MLSQLGLRWGAAATLPIGSVSRALGLLAATQGSLDLAVDHLEAAMLQHESIDSPPLLAWTLLDMARVLDRRRAAGDPARSRRLVREALGMGRTLGMHRLAARPRRCSDPASGGVPLLEVARTALGATQRQYMTELASTRRLP